MKAIGYNSARSWIAAFSCAVVGFLLYIPLRLAGLLFVVILDGYETDRKLATLSFVLLGIERALGGPFIGFLGEIIGLQEVALIGCILSAAGVGACFFAEDITAITICLGVIYGIGFSFGLTLLNSIIRLHFTENINLANGIYSAGMCLAGPVMSPVVEHLRDSYGTAGMFLILSGIMLNAIPACILLGDPNNKRQNSNSHEKEKVKTISESLENNTASNQDMELRKNDSQCLCKNINIKISPEKESTCSTNEQNNIEFCKTCTNKQERNGDIDKNSPGLIPVVKNDIANTTVSGNTEDCHKKEQTQFKYLPGDNQSVKKKNLLSLESLRLFADPTFYLTMIVQSVYGFLSTLSWTVILDYGRDKQIETSRAVYFFMFLPVAEMVGNLSLNWITDRGLMSRTNFCMICYFVLSIDAGMLIWVQSFVPMMIVVIIFGFTCGALFTTFPGMIIEFIEENQQNMALASQFILYAFLTACKSPLVGYFREDLGSYDWIYCIIALMCITSGVLVKFTPIAAAYRIKRAMIKSSETFSTDL